MWDSMPHRLALLELYARGRLPRRRSQEQAWQHLSDLGWGGLTGRRGELELRRAEAVMALLDEKWPDWREVHFDLETLGLTPDERGWKELERRRQAARLGPLPKRINQRTAGAAVARHSKATLTPAHLRSLEPSQVTRDGQVRLRPSEGLIVRREGREYPAAELAWLLGDVTITERALQDGTCLAGQPPAAILLVENLGVYVDMPVPAGWMAVHVAGWDTHTVLQLLQSFRKTLWVLFGDLDPNGVKIQRHLREANPDLRWLIPAYWAEYPSQTTTWPDGRPAPRLRPSPASSPGRRRPVARAGSHRARPARAYPPAW